MGAQRVLLSISNAYFSSICQNKLNFHEYNELSELIGNVMRLKAIMFTLFFVFLEEYLLGNIFNSRSILENS